MAFFTHACEARNKGFRVFYGFSISLVHIFENLQEKSTNSSNYFGKFFSPKTFFNTSIKIICAWSVGQLR